MKYVERRRYMALIISVNHHEFFLLVVREGIDRDPRLIIDIEFPSAYNIPPKAED